MRVLRRVVYITKSKGPRTEPRGTPYSEVCKEENQSLHFTQKVRDERFCYVRSVLATGIAVASNYTA